MFSLAHLHLILNHLPIVLIPLGLLMLGIGWYRKLSILQYWGLGILGIAGFFALPVYLTGEEAEHVVEELAGVSEHVLEEHEEWGQRAMIISLMLSSFSIFTWIRLRQTGKLDARLGGLVLGLGMMACVALGLTALEGGEIRRPELRGESPSSMPANSPEEHEVED
jgi:uncharacterized membrane protein